MMNQKEWVELFQATNGRNPEPAEFSEALKNGEFKIEPVQTEQNVVEEQVAENHSENLQPKSVISQKDLLLNTELRALRKQIEEKDTTLSKHFFELGLAYYNQSINQKDIDLEKEVSAIIGILQESYKLRQDYNIHVPREKSCLACGNLLSSDSRFCSVCGSDVQELSALEEATLKECDLCSTSQAGKNKFCACCGKEFA
ncbi:zinc ribbon domain-containing protein [Streptococcus suis]|uniref:zinc ribbon domain-containing protein n=1 Tax=Streptococcus suis TaxID=1307 RepID=UPI00128FFB5D|nr:zinc ribbon domain-containing protein [Streptococcus suis]